MNRKQKAKQHFIDVGEWFDGAVLHHKDTTLKSLNPERYNKWLIEDLQVMSRSEHATLHLKMQHANGERKPGMLGKHQSEETKRKIGKANSTKTRSKELRNQISKSLHEYYENLTDEERQRISEINSLSHSNEIIVYDKNREFVGSYRNRRVLKEELLGVNLNVQHYVGTNRLYKNKYYFEYKK